MRLRERNFNGKRGIPSGKNMLTIGMKGGALVNEVTRELLDKLGEAMRERDLVSFGSSADLTSLENERGHLKRYLQILASSIFPRDADVAPRLSDLHYAVQYVEPDIQPTEFVNRFQIVLRQHTPGIIGEWSLVCAEAAGTLRKLFVSFCKFAVKWSAIHCSAAFLIQDLEAIAKAVSRRLTTLDWMIATLLRLQSKKTLQKSLTLIERAWFLLHGSHPPRAITPLRPSLGY